MKQSQYGVWIFDQLGANLHYELPQKQWVTWLCRCIQTLTAWSPQNPKYHKLSIDIYCAYCNPTRPDSVYVLPAGWRHFTMSPWHRQEEELQKSVAPNIPLLPAAFQATALSGYPGCCRVSKVDLSIWHEEIEMHHILLVYKVQIWDILRYIYILVVDSGRSIN